MSDRLTLGDVLLLGLVVGAIVVVVLVWTAFRRS